MITLSTNKGLIKVDDWENIESRPGFSTNLNPKDHELQAIIGRYVSGDKKRCGLSDCHSPHSKGYIVSTKDGKETNIGKDCGQKYFGVDFDVQAAQFDRDITQQDNRELLWNFSFTLEELEKKLSEMRRGANGADWVHKNSQALVVPGGKVPSSVIREITKLVKARSSSLYRVVQATEQEVEDLEAIRGIKVERPHYTEELLGDVYGLFALYPENNLRDNLVFGIEERIKGFKAEAIDQMSYERLTFWKKWVSSIEGTLDNAANTIAAGLVLLTATNLSPLLKIIDNGTDRIAFREFINSL
jgi:hypothetical protein